MKIDLHLHSFGSFDSFNAPRRIVSLARKKGLDVIAITDHNNIRVAKEVKKFSKKKPIVIIGQEIETDKGEIIGLFLDRLISVKIFSKAIKEIKRQNGLVVLTHPFKRKNVILEGKEINFIDLIEVYNSRADFFENEMSLRFAKKHNIPIVAGSDAHFGFEIGRTYIDFKDKMQAEKDLKRILLSSPRKIVGRKTSLFVEALSQMVAFLKTRRVCYFIKFLNIFIYAFFREVTPNLFQKTIYQVFPPKNV